jgi:Ca2+-binding EF-hand superfamily protein
MKMRKLTLTFVAGAAALALGGVAHAQAAPQAQPMTRVAVEQRSDKAFDRLDANHDGKLDRNDRAERQKARFERLDSNSDGSLSYDEFAAARADREGARQQRLAARGDRPGRHGTHRMAARRFGRGGMVRLADADKDGAITRDEFGAAALARFDRLDADKDGTVTREEAKAARDSMRQRWQARHEAQRAG